jgi:predicted ester cyclase
VPIRYHINLAVLVPDASVDDLDRRWCLRALSEWTMSLVTSGGGGAMAAIVEIAERFFDACETGQGWQECQQYCHEGATFSAQAAALEGVDSLQAYTEWMKGLFTPLPDGRAEVISFAVDEARNKVLAYGVFHGSHTGEGGPVAPTGKSAAADYVYDMAFEGDKIRHMTKIWNDGVTMHQLGWV